MINIAFQTTLKSLFHYFDDNNGNNNNNNNLNNHSMRFQFALLTLLIYLKCKFNLVLHWVVHISHNDSVLDNYRIQILFRPCHLWWWRIWLHFGKLSREFGNTINKWAKCQNVTSCAHLGSVCSAFVSRWYGVKTAAGAGCEILSSPSTANARLQIPQNVKYL